ncbi:MAG TPA: LysR family transcriptional regulator [Burkholderiales bacterium]|nr:LysR family transcriptional regulator [Burkholderiales bacterium]
MELRHLRYFVAVAEHLSFARAARALHLSQPPLSRQIRALEDELGTALFARTKRAVALAPAGAALLPEARRLLREADALKAGARAHAMGDIGALALGFIGMAAYNVLPGVLPEFHRLHPGVRLALREATSDVLLAALRQGDIDVALVLPPADDAGVEYATLHRDGLVAALPASRREFRGRGPLRLAALAAEPFILFPRRVGTSLYDHIVGLCRRTGFSPRVEQEAIQMQTIVSLVAAGMGVALVPASLMNMRRTGVVYRPLAERSPAVEVGVVWRRSDEAPATRAFLASARAWAARQGARSARLPARE